MSFWCMDYLCLCLVGRRWWLFGDDRGLLFEHDCLQICVWFLICKVYTRTLWFLQLCMDLYVFDFKKCIKLCWALLIFDVLIWVLSETQSQSVYYIEHLRFWFGLCLKHPNSNLKFVFDIGRLKFWFGFSLNTQSAISSLSMILDVMF